VLLAGEAGDLGPLGVEQLAKLQEQRRDGPAAGAPQPLDRPLAGRAGLGARGGLGRLGEEGDGGAVALQAEHIGDQRLAWALLAAERHAQRHDRLRAHLDKDLLGDGLQLRAGGIDQRLEELGRGVLAGRQQPLGREVSPLQLPGGQLDVAVDLLGRAGPFEAALLVPGFEGGGGPFERPADIGAHGLAQRAAEPLILAAGVHQVGERLGREVTGEQLLPDELGRVVAVDEHIVDEIAELLLRSRLVGGLCEHAPGRGPERQRRRHDTENTTGRRSTHGSLLDASRDALATRSRWLLLRSCEAPEDPAGASAAPVVTNGTPESPGKMPPLLRGRSGNVHTPGSGCQSGARPPTDPPAWPAWVRTPIPARRVHKNSPETPKSWAGRPGGQAGHPHRRSALPGGGGARHAHFRCFGEVRRCPLKKMF